MAYEASSVPVARSQEGIRKLLRDNGAYSFAAVSDRDPVTSHAVEGFESRVKFSGSDYRIRIMAKVKEPQPPKRGRVYRGSLGLTEKQKADMREQEERRIWRVLYYHMKDLFEAANSGVMDFRELILPYIVTGDGRSIAEHILPKLNAIVTAPGRMLVGEVPRDMQDIPNQRQRFA